MGQPHVVVLDYGSGNLRSAVRAVERAGAEVEVTSDMDAAMAADGLLVPGVGAYEACMKGLRAIRGERIIGRRLSGGRPVLRINLTAGTATLISPALAGQAVTGGVPPTTPDPAAVAPVSAAAPTVAVRVSSGGDGRLLVLAANDEDGWRATDNGEPAPIVRAWGHLVAVAVPIEASDVRIWLPNGARPALLIVQAALLLITVVSAVPVRRREPRLRR